MPTWNQIQNQLRHPKNPVVFFDISVGNTEVGRILIELFSDGEFFILLSQPTLINLISSNAKDSREL